MRPPPSPSPPPPPHRSPSATLADDTGALASADWVNPLKGGAFGAGKVLGMEEQTDEKIDARSLLLSRPRSLLACSRSICFVVVSLLLINTQKCISFWKKSLCQQISWESNLAYL